MKALCGVGFGESSAQKGVVGGVRPTRSIIAAIGDEAVEEGVWIIVIPHPTGTCDIKIQFVQGAQVGGPLLVAEFDFHPENTPPLGLNFYRNLFVQFRFIVEKRDARESMAFRIAGQLK